MESRNSIAKSLRKIDLDKLARLEDKHYLFTMHALVLLLDIRDLLIEAKPKKTKKKKKKKK